MPPAGALVPLVISGLATGGAAVVAGASLSAAGAIAGVTFGAGLLQRSVFQQRPSQEGIQGNVASGVASTKIVYGTTKMGGALSETRVDPNSEDRKFLFRGVAPMVASEDGSGIEGVTKVFFDERLAIDGPTLNTDDETAGVTDFFSGKLTYRIGTGSDSQSVDGVANARFSSEWPTSSRGLGIAYVHTFLTFDKEVFSSGIPNITAEVKGNRVYDPRDQTWKWSNNPALCILDYLTSKRYGVGAPYPERDGGTEASEIDEQSFIDLANFCEEQVQDGSGGVQDRFTCDVWLDTEANWAENLEILKSSARAELVYQGGQWRVFSRKPVTPVDFTLDESNIIGDWTWKRAGSREVPNTVIAKFPNENNRFVTDEVQWPDPGNNPFLDDDNSVPKQMEIDLPATTNFVRAQQIAMVLLREAREDVGAQLTATEAALELEAGDVVKITHPTPDWTDKEMWVDEVGILPPDPSEGGESARARLTLSEFDSNAYSLDPQNAEPTVPGSSLPDPFSIAPVTNLTLTSDQSTQLITPAGDKIPRIKATWTPPQDPFFDRTEISVRRTEDAGGSPVDEDFERLESVDGAERLDNGDQQKMIGRGREGETWEVKVVAVNTFGPGLRSDPVTATVVLDTDFVASDIGGAFVLEDIQEDDFDGDGTVEGRLTLTTAAASGTFDVEFATRQGRGTTWNTQPLVTGLSSGQQTSQDVDLIEGQNAFIRYELFKAGTTNSLARSVVTFDPDAVAEVGPPEITLDVDRNVIVSGSGDSDTTEIRARVGIDADPVDPDGTVDDDLVINARAGTGSTGVKLSRGQTAHVKIRGVNANSELGPVTEGRLRFGDTRGGIVEENIAETGTTGTLTLTVRAEVGSYDIQFETKQGRDGSFVAAGSATALTAGQFTQQDVTLVEGDLSFIRYEITDNDEGTLLGGGTVAFDADRTAEVNTLVATLTPSDTVLVAAGGDSDTTEIRARVGVDADPPDPDDTASDSVIAGRVGSVDTGVALARGEEARVKARSKNSDGVLGPVKEARLLFGDTRGIVVEDVSETDTAGTLALTIVAETGAYDVQFETKQGRDGSFVSGTSASGLTLGQTTQDSVTLVEKDLSFVKYEVFEAGTTKRVAGSVVAFDQEQVAQVQHLGAWIRDDGTPGADAGGDSDTAKIHLTMTTDGSEPVDPTAANADATINAREGSVTFAGTVPKGNILWVKARGENAATTLAPVETIKSDQQVRPGGDTGVLVVPTATAEPLRTTNPVFQDVTLDAIAGALGTSSLEVNYKLIEAQTGRLILDWQGWRAAPDTVTVSRGAVFDRELVYKARDTGVQDNPESAEQTLFIPPFIERGDLPGLGRGPLEDDRHRSGFGGEVPGAESVKGPVRSADGLRDLIDTASETVTDNMLRPSDNAPINTVQQHLSSVGFARTTMLHGSGFPILRHQEDDVGADMDTNISFDQTFDAAPRGKPTPGDGARVYLSSNPNDDQRHQLKLSGLDQQGFDELIGEVIVTSSTTDIVDGFSATQNAGAPENGNETLASDGDEAFSNLEDANDNPADYNVFFDVDTTGLESGSSVTLRLFVNDGATSTNWTEVWSGAWGAGRNLADQKATFNAALGADFDIRALVEANLQPPAVESFSVVMHGEDNAEPGVQWTRDDGTTGDTMSPAAGQNVQWEVKDVA